MARQPAYRLTLNGQPATTLQGRVVDLNLRDNRGFEADQLDLTLSDHDGQIALPPEGAIIGVAIGWEGEALVPKGDYQVDEIEHSGPPDVLTIRARSADFRAGLLEKRTQSWHAITLGDIVATIAERHQLTPAVGDALADELIAHVDQTDESDAHFLTRLAHERDAIATVKGVIGEAHLLFVRAGEARTASGRAIPSITIRRKDGDRHAYTRAGRDNQYTGVRARWLDREEYQVNEVLAGDEGNVKALRKTYPSEVDALSAAAAEWRRLTRAGRSMSVTLSVGNPELMAESPVTLEGWKKGIDGSGWVTTRVEHRINDSGYTVEAPLEPVAAQE